MLDTQLDNAIARAGAGPAHTALEAAETLALKAAGCPAEATTTFLTTATTPATSVRVNRPIVDTATLTGDDPTGTIAFTVFPNGSCSLPGTAVAPAATVNGSGSYNSGSFTPTSAGSYSFSASYSGDLVNAAVTSACEPFTATKATPKVTTTLPSMMVAPNSSFQDSATLAGGFHPTGQITFTFFSTAGNCTGTSSVVPPNATVSGNGSYHSGTLTAPAAPGSYSLRARYGGDANNAGATSPCELFMVGQGGSGSG